MANRLQDADASHSDKTATVSQQGVCTWVPGIAAALQCLLQAQEVLLTLGARVAVILPPMRDTHSHCGEQVTRQIACRVTLRC